MDMKLELVPVPVTDVDRAKAFYTEKIGFNADHDHQVNDELRFVQLTPPGSACSIAIGTGLTEMEPGSIEGLMVVVADEEAARDEVMQRGTKVSEINVQPSGSGPEKGSVRWAPTPQPPQRPFRRGPWCCPPTPRQRYRQQCQAASRSCSACPRFWPP